MFWSRLFSKKIPTVKPKAGPWVLSEGTSEDGYPTFSGYREGPPGWKQCMFQGAHVGTFGIVGGPGNFDSYSVDNGWGDECGHVWGKKSMDRESVRRTAASVQKWVDESLIGWGWELT